MYWKISTYILIVFTIFNLWPLSQCKIGPGVWMDDGFGHTVKAEMDANDAKVLEEDMLHALGLPTPPRHRRHNRHSNGSAPNFLKNVYESLDERGRAPNFDLGYRSPYSTADTIITFISRTPPQGRPKNQGNRILYFNFDDVLMDHSLLGAELKIHRKAKSKNPTNLTLHIYLITEDSYEEEIVNTPLIREGWMSVNITSAVLSWIIFPSSNFGIKIAITRQDLKHELHLHDVGIAGAHDIEDFRPFLVGFFALPANPTNPTKKRISRSKRSPTPKVSSRVSVRTMMTDVSTKPETNYNECQKKQLHVSFDDLGWQEWLIAPRGYDANFCDGSCEFPIPAQVDATNHAYVQNLIKIVREKYNKLDIPPIPCCAPKDLTTLTVLYYDYSGNVVLKKFPKMIVKHCGCL